jgi:hypothetical protein
MRPGRFRRWKARTSTLALVVLSASGEVTVDLCAQARGFARGGGATSTSRFVSPTVVASWMSHENYGDGSKTTLLVLWRGKREWFAKRGSAGASGKGAGSISGSSGGGSYSYEYFTEGGLTFLMEFDYDKRIVKMLNQEISLTDTNVVLVDFVDTVNGPTIVDHRWIEPGPPAPPVVPDAAPDPIAGIIRRSPELFEYLQCDLKVTDPVLSSYMPLVCGQMRGPKQ